MQLDRSTVNEGPKLNLKSLILKVLSSSKDEGCLGGDFETSVADLSCLGGDLGCVGFNYVGIVFVI